MTCCSKKYCVKLYLKIFIVIFFISSCDIEESNNENIYFRENIDLSLVQETDWIKANELFLLVNQYRESLGLPTLELDENYISAVATLHTKNMIQVEMIAHQDFFLRKEAILREGATIVAENLAYGYQTSSGIFNAWLASPEHKNLIEGEFNFTGLGLIIDQDNKIYCTQIFVLK